MNGEMNEFKAPWGLLLKGMSLFVVVLFAGITISGLRAGEPWWIVLFPLLLLLAVPFIVRGYAIEGNDLIIQRPFWKNRFPLSELQSAEVVPNAFRRTIRLCGNGGLFSITGLYRNKTIGNFWSYANDLKDNVVLRFAKRTIVVSPDDPKEFMQVIKEQMGNKA